MQEKETFLRSRLAARWGFLSERETGISSLPITEKTGKRSGFAEGMHTNHPGPGFFISPRPLLKPVSRSPGPPERVKRKYLF